MSEPEIPYCGCGEAMPHALDAKAGEEIVCFSCGKMHRCLGGGLVKGLRNRGPTESKMETREMISVESEEVFKFDDTSKKTDLKERKRAAEKRREMAQARASGAPLPSDPGSKTRPSNPQARPREIPGGVLPMIGFMIGFTGLALVLVNYVLLPADFDGLRHSAWGTVYQKPRIPWPELLAIVGGNLIGFTAWGIYAYVVFKREKNAPKSDARRSRRVERNGDSEEDEEAA